MSKLDKLEKRLAAVEQKPDQRVLSAMDRVSKIIAKDAARKVQDQVLPAQ